MYKRPVDSGAALQVTPDENTVPVRPVKRLSIDPHPAGSQPEPDGERPLVVCTSEILGACPPCAQAPTASTRRPKNRLACNGCDGCPNGAGCTAVFEQPADLRKHKHQDIRACGVCGKAYTRTSDFYRHFRKAHRKLLDAQGACAAHGVPATRPSPQTLPEAPWKARLDAIDARHNLAPGTMWAALTEGGGYSALVMTVCNCVMGDLKKPKVTAAQRAYAARLRTDPVRRHALAQQILAYAIERELLWPGATDDLGGVVRSGLKLRAHAGLWGLSLDRRDNAQSHFSENGDIIGPGTNLRAVAAGMNTRSNPGDHWDDATCARLRAELARPVTEAMVQSAIAAEATATNGGKSSILYRSTSHAFKDPKAKAAFGTVAAMFAYTKELLSEQGARCAVSGILMRGLSGPVEERVFRMSVDAVDPLKGHVRGNLRLICQFLQACAGDKTKKTADADDGPSQWTPDLFREYIGLD